VRTLPSEPPGVTFRMLRRGLNVSQGLIQLNFFPILLIRARSLAPGDIVVMDNLGSHKGRAVRAASCAAKAKLFFLPAYSPDLNPIEQAFAKMKTLLRKADARTIDETWRTIGALLDCFTPTECANYFRNAGYASA
jgi:transposase